VTGAGLTSAGAFPAGFGSVSTNERDTSKIFENETGDQFGARYIDPVTRQYSFQSSGRMKGMSSVAQLVELAFLTTRSSSVLTNFGLEPHRGVIGSNFEATRKQAIEQALSYLTGQGFIEIVSIDVDVKSRPVTALVRWRDLTTSESSVTETRV